MDIKVERVAYEIIEPLSSVGIKAGLPMGNMPGAEWFVLYDGKDMAGVSCGIVITGTIGLFRVAYIGKAYRGKGLYDYLYEAQLESFRRAGVKHLAALCNSKSLGFFLRQGFAPVEGRKLNSDYTLVGRSSCVGLGDSPFMGQNNLKALAGVSALSYPGVLSIRFTI
jgi:hypothetical protein